MKLNCPSRTICPNEEEFKKKNLFLFDHFVNTIHTYTLSMSYIYNLNNINMKILANMVIMRINNNKSRVRRLL